MFSQLSVALTEHILGTDACWFFTGYFVVVRLAAVCIGFWFGKYLSGAVSEQMWARLRLKERYGIPKTIQEPVLCVFLDSIAGEILEKEGRNEMTQSLIRRAGLEVHQLSPVRPWPKSSKRTPPWRTWTWVITTSAPWCLVWMVWRRGSEPQDFIGRIKIQPLENEVWSQWNPQKGPESNAQCILSLLISNERQVRGNTA